jgi:NAD-dependent SIR2 family protein deacetylase
LAELEGRGVIAGLITQNVDGLHHAAGSRSVIELHGNLRRVGCLDCGAFESREALQQRLRELNPSAAQPFAAMAPDGDADLDGLDVSDFRVAACRACGGVLKPAVVFFGEGVPRERVDAAYRLVEASEAMLVVGSSLTVFSGLRFVRHAAERGHAVGIINLGSTRGDALAQLRLDAKAGEVLPKLLDGLT